MCCICVYVCVYTDGSCLVHSTSGELLHKLVSSSNWSLPHLVMLTSRGDTVVHYTDQKGCMVTYSCNGAQLAQCALGDPALVCSNYQHWEILM